MMFRQFLTTAALCVLGGTFVHAQQPTDDGVEIGDSVCVRYVVFNLMPIGSQCQSKIEV
jgi:hypothetical protein